MRKNRSILFPSLVALCTAAPVGVAAQSVLLEAKTAAGDEVATIRTDTMRLLVPLHLLGGGLLFPDGTLQTTAAGGALSVTSSQIVNGTIVNVDISASAAIADTKLGPIQTAGKVANSATTATASNTANAIVARDASGGFEAGYVAASDSLRVRGGSFLATGTVDATTTAPAPVSGAGARLMWFPEKGALRAGYVTGTQWDGASIGVMSTALGYNTIASGHSATALGGSTTASGRSSIALGGNTSAVGDYSTALGAGTAARGAYSTALGYHTTASVAYSTSFGSGSIASGAYSIAAGYNTIASGGFSTTFGDQTAASADYATAFGYHTTAAGTNATVLGRYSSAGGNTSTAAGYYADASADYSSALGNHATASGASSTALGFYTTASADYSTALGSHTTAAWYGSVVIGRYNTVNYTRLTTWNAGDPLFMVGNGSSSTSLSDALVLMKDGNLMIAGTLHESSDARLKEGIQPLEGTLERVLRLTPIRYSFRAGTGHPAGTQIGLTAQEVEPLFPELVSRGGDGYLSLSYANLSAVLVRAVQEQQAEIEALRSRNDSLESELASLRASQAEVLRRLRALEAAGGQ